VSTSKSTFSPTPGRRFHKRVRAFVHSVTYNFETRIGTIWLQDGGSSDFTGSIETIKQIDPEARRVEVYRNDQLDIIYAGAGSEWKSFDVRRGARMGGK